MAVLTRLYMSLSAFSFFLAFCSDSATSDRASLPKFAFSWLNDKDSFRAGDTAIIKIKVLENADKIDKNAFKLILTVNGKDGNSSYVSTVLSNFGGDLSDWKIFFTPIMVGLFNVIVKEEKYEVFDSSMHFQVEPGNMYPSVCVASWKGLKNEFDAGDKATLLILPKDAFGNNISAAKEVPDLHEFTVSILQENGSLASVTNITYIGWNEFSYIVIEFIVMKAGNLTLSIAGGNQTLNGSPLPFRVSPGPIDVSNCVAKWKFEPSAWQLYSKMELLIHQLDQYSNLVPGLYSFDAEVVERETKLSVPVADLHFEEVDAGIQLFSFSNLEPGNFLLTIYDMKHNKSISNMPYAYTVFVGYCDGVNSIVNGSGLNASVAGQMAEFTVYLIDKYQYPSPVEAERLQVQIMRENDSHNIWPIIYPLQNINGSRTAAGERQGGTSLIEIAPAPSVELANNVKTKECISEVNISVSGVRKFSPKVPKLLMNEIIVQLKDSFLNPVPSQQSRLKLEIASINSSGFSTWNFVDNNDGSYSGQYMAKEVGTYEVCASFDGNRFSPCPFGVNVYTSEYFPTAYNDTISIWEDESIAFDALANDYFAGDNASIVEFSKPDHGSLLLSETIFRYTPYRDYYGNDSFRYTISDVNGNLATASVYINVLSIPPQFVSFPSQLQATEDVLNPKFGGFSGFEIRYSDPMENISVNVSAHSGTILLSPMVMQFWQPIWSGLFINAGNEASKDLILEGSAEVINFALQSVQYLGNENFCGGDTIRVSTRNRNGINAVDVPVFVEPINDPPFIQVPDFIILRGNGDESLIFDKEKDKFHFFIGDPDLLTYPGAEALFGVTFSLEVNNGFLVTNLPAHLINTTELKLKNSYHWQPLQTFVTISKHFMVKASGIRFRGSVNDCNSIMQRLFYHEGEHGAVLTVTLNDMGNFGCYPDCADGLSVPLYTEATVNLIRRRPMSSLVAHALGSAIVIEFVILFSLGVALLYFTCKCAILLVHERRNHDTRASDLTSSQVSNKLTVQSSKNVTENPTYFPDCCSSSFLLGGQSSNFRQRFRSQSQIGEPSKAAYHSPRSSSDTQLHSVVPNLVPLSIEKEQN